MVKKIFNSPIPSWAVMVLVAVLIVGLGFFLNRFGKITYDYDLIFKDVLGSEERFEYGSWPALSNAEFFKTVKEKFIDEKADFIEGDLSDMVLKVYKKGALAKEVKILSKGKEGSWWETPAGVYKIQSKEKNHFSSFGEVYMPYSMAFQGNFFIHGWPYYPGGEPVAEGYSGGCIRLSDKDAQQVYDLVEIGTPVLVFEKDFLKDDFSYDFEIPGITSQAYLAADLRNNFVFLEKNSSKKMPIASITKLMTAIVSTEYINLDREVVISNSMKATTSLPRLKTGQSISAYNLLFPLLEESSNEAAAALASFLGKVRFVDLMNVKSISLGMNDTHFADTSGAHEDNVSTAEDLFALSKYLYNNRSFILKLSAGKLTWSAYGTSEFQNLKNLNVFGNDPDFAGGKVGMSTAAKQTIVSIFNLKLKEEERPVVIIVLGSEDNAGDARKILDYIKNYY